MFKLANLHKSIARRLILATVLTSSIITTIFTSLSFYMDYNVEMDAIENIFKQVEDSYIEVLATSIWDMDPSQIDKQLNGVMSFGDIIAVELLDVQDDIQVKIEKENKKLFDYSFNRIFDMEVEGLPVGRLKVSVTKYFIFMRLIDKAVVFFVSQGLKTFIVSFFIFLIFQKLISGHIIDIVQQLKRKNLLEFSTQNNLIKLNRSETDDELSFLVTKLNDCLAIASENLASQDRVIEEQNKSAMQSAKMAEIGEMAGGIAHEINNPLAIIIGNADQGIRFFDAKIFNKDGTTSRLLKIRTMSSRILVIIQGLLYFARSETNEPKKLVDFKNTIEKDISLAGEKIRTRGINIQTDLPEGVSVECWEIQISQVFLNILNNAIDAVSSLEELKERWIKVESHLVDSELLEVRISNGGPKIAKEVAAKLFNPFFTTKPIGEGTGLGLSISKGIVESHEGNLIVENHGKHTSLLIRLPIAS